MSKLSLFRSLIIVLLFCSLAWDGCRWLNHSLTRIPEKHQELILTGVLLWISAVFLGPSNDDDWVEQY
jgi:hypothetical protein